MLLGMLLFRPILRIRVILTVGVNDAFNRVFSILKWCEGLIPEWDSKTDDLFDNIVDGSM